MIWRNPSYQPRQDTGWGLIFRLNKLLDQLENVIKLGDLNTSSFLLDRLFIDSSYKNEIEVHRDKQGNIVSYKFIKDDSEVFDMFNRKINETKMAIIDAKENEEWSELKKLRLKLYGLISDKNRLIIIVLTKRNLYINKKEFDPSKAIRGGYNDEY